MLAKQLAALLMQHPDMPVVKCAPDGSVSPVRGYNVVRMTGGEIFLPCEEEVLMQAISGPLSEEAKRAAIRALPQVISI